MSKILCNGSVTDQAEFLSKAGYPRTNPQGKKKNVLRSVYRILYCSTVPVLYFSTITFQADRIAAGFLALGLQPGDRLGIWGSNTYEWYLTQFAAAKAGLILVRHYRTLKH